MASNTSTTDEVATPLAELGARIAARRVTMGRGDVPRNSGVRRTESKRALLKAIEDAGGKW